MEHSHENMIIGVLKEIRDELRSIHCELHCYVRRPAHLRIKFSHHHKGVPMPVNLKVGQTVTAAPVETDATGVSVAITDPTAIAWTTSDPGIASVGPVDNSGGVVFTAAAAGTVTVTVTDPANQLHASDTITVEVVVPPATNLSIDFGDPK